MGEDLLLIAVTGLYAEAQQRGTGQRHVWDLAQEVFAEARLRIKQQIRELVFNQDNPVAVLGTKALGGTYPSLSKGIIERNLEDYRVRVDTSASTVEKQEHAAV